METNRGHDSVQPRGGSRADQVTATDDELTIEGKPGGGCKLMASNFEGCAP